MVRTKFLSIVLFLISYLLFVPATHAAGEFRSDYTVDYYVQPQGSNVNTKVVMTTKVTNLTEDIYVNKYTLSFPNSFAISEMSARDDKGSVTPEITKTDSATDVKLAFNKPEIGKNSTNTLFLEFNQAQLLTVSGNVWEIVLPTMGESVNNGSYSVRVHLSDGQKKLSIARPKPTSINGNTITWENPAVKTIFGVFGDAQIYELNLRYHLSNDQIRPVYTDIAFPLDTLYQRVFVDTIVPRPASVTIDSDGNYLGRYNLAPKEQKSIVFNGWVVVSVRAREEMVESIRNQYKNQKAYLTKKTKYWNVVAPASLDSPAKIFDFVSSSLEYDFSRVDVDVDSESTTRLGASGALKQPEKAVCIEFTDLFVAMARDRGFSAREIEGYGFSTDERFRPLSLAQDVLHAWPEYYDSKTELWKQVDPTWQNTSGIDYFNSFDLNHVAFVIHGKQDDYPVPAGMYKKDDNKDIDIRPIAREPVAKEKLELRVQMPTTMMQGRTYEATLQVTNIGNVFLYNKQIDMSANVTLPKKQFIIEAIAPYQTITIPFAFVAQEKEVLLSVAARGEKPTLYRQRLVQTNTLIYVGLGMVVAILLLVTLIVRTSRKKHADMHRFLAQPNTSSASQLPEHS